MPPKTVQFWTKKIWAPLFWNHWKTISDKREKCTSIWNNPAFKSEKQGPNEEISRFWVGKSWVFLTKIFKKRFLKLISQGIPRKMLKVRKISLKLPIEIPKLKQNSWISYSFWRFFSCLHWFWTDFLENQITVLFL